MRRIFLFAIGTLTLTVGISGQTGPRGDFKKPKLVLGIVVDQFRYDYLTKFRKDYTGGFARFMKNGAVFTNAYHEHFPTVTAIGHSTFMSGATPSISGIVNNSWYDRDTGQTVTSVSDDNAKLLGATGKGSSPRRMLAGTLGDEMKMAGCECKVIGISIKDRSAILPAGHIADGAYWFDGQTGNFVSSTFYFPELPAWVKSFNDKRPADQYAAAKWKAFDSNTIYKTMPEKPGSELYGALEAAPFGNDLIEAFAEQAMAAEKIGAHAGTDLLTVSFSANDYVGHRVGPDDPMVRDISVQTDRLLEKFFNYIDSTVGLDNVLVVLTADHGVAPLPEVSIKRGMPGGRANAADMFRLINAALVQKYGDGKWIEASSGPIPYFNRELARQKNATLAEVERTAAEVLRNLPNIFRVYTRDEIIHGQMIEDRFSQRVRNGFYASRSGDLIIIPDAYWIFEPSGASHGTAFNYDTHVPILFMGPNVRPGFYDGAIAVNDIAPTLATILSIETPSGSVGRVLSEMFAR